MKTALTINGFITFKFFHLDSITYGLTSTNLLNALALSYLRPRHNSNNNSR